MRYVLNCDNLEGPLTKLVLKHYFLPKIYKIDIRCSTYIQYQGNNTFAGLNVLDLKERGALES